MSDIVASRGKRREVVALAATYMSHYPLLSCVSLEIVLEGSVNEEFH